MSIEFNPLLTKKNGSKKERIVSRTKEDLLYQLSKQYKFICRSLLKILKGDMDEIDRLSIGLRILFHNTRHSTGILSQLEEEIKIFDTCKEKELPPSISESKEEDVQPYCAFIGNMVCMSIGSKDVWQLTPSGTPTWSSPEDWWNKVLFVENNVSFTREKMTLSIADTDGGAHVDRKLEHDYFLLSRKGSTSMNFFVNSNQFYPFGPEKVIMPHMGLEVVASFRRFFPETCIDFGLPDLSQKF